MIDPRQIGLFDQVHPICSKANFKKRTAVNDVLPLLRARLSQFGLTLSEEKTHKTHLGRRDNTSSHERRHMNFLGFTIYRAKNRSGTGVKTVFATSSKRLGRAKHDLKQKLKAIRHWPVADQAKAINAILRGHNNYYGIAGNATRIARFYNFAREEWRHWLSKRSQHRIPWDEFVALEQKHALVPPKIRITYPQMASYVRL